VRSLVDQLLGFPYDSDYTVPRRIICRYAAQPSDRWGLRLLVGFCSADDPEAGACVLVTFPFFFLIGGQLVQDKSIVHGRHAWHHTTDTKSPSPDFILLLFSSIGIP
jgi:hypothetical protein